MTKREEATRQFLQDPDAWPCYPYLPLVRREPYPGNPYGELGVLHADDVPTAESEDKSCPYKKVKPKVLFTLLPLLLMGADPAETAKVCYDTLDAMLADGWLVD